MKQLLKLGITLIGLVTLMQVHAQPVIRFVTGSSPGAGVDVITRAVGEAMATVLNRTIIVENKPGAAYNIAADHVAKAAADGNTVLVTFNVHPVAGALNPQLSYDPVKDFRAVGLIASTPYVIVANRSLAGDDLKQAIALAKTRNASPAFGSIGAGTPQHLMMERLKAQTGVDIRMIHYKSAGTLVTDLIAGHVDFSILTISTAEQHVKNGRLKVLAVTSAQRLPQFPDAPTIAETGYKDFVTDGWYAMLLPAKTSVSVVNGYSQALNKVLDMPALREKLHAVGASATPSTPDVLDRRMRDDAEMWRQVIKTNNIKPD